MAMLGAFLQYKKQHEELRLEHLEGIEHRVPEFVEEVQNIAPTNMLRCMAPNCGRCERRRGGYQFRRHSLAWQDQYEKYKRAGAWTAPMMRELRKAGE